MEGGGREEMWALRIQWTKTGCGTRHWFCSSFSSRFAPLFNSSGIRSHIKFRIFFRKRCMTANFLLQSSGTKNRSDTFMNCSSLFSAARLVFHGKGLGDMHTTTGGIEVAGVFMFIKGIWKHEQHTRSVQVKASNRLGSGNQENSNRHNHACD